ncbi:hypothetical protein RUM43_000607 [Polyplax serrata]|uniref:Chaoptin n=1 Tax=Polyplax serrata TaxID=468196 RepID=A0AAN8SCR6_POLSC
MSDWTLNILLCLTVFNSLTAANEENHDPPCFFNPLCLCSKSYPDLGRVTCKDVLLLSIPHQINSSKLYFLHLENNGLKYLESRFFTRTGLSKIEITRNLLREISAETFAGLERSLWELNLQQNKFKRIPTQSLRYLRKLRYLDLSDNEIRTVGLEDWMGLEESLKILNLRRNKLSTLGPKTFSLLRRLETLDLTGNAIFELDALVFKGGLMQLTELNLSNNLLSEVPINQISELRELRFLDVSYNRIAEIRDFRSDHTKGKSTTLSLDTLRLDYNQIEYLPALSFESFPALNRTYLTGNPIAHLEKGTFERSKIREVYMGDCEISELTPDAFTGLESHLEILHVEGNNLRKVPKYFFKEFKLLKWLNLKSNFIGEFDFDEMFDGAHPSLEKLDVGEQLIPKVNFRSWSRLENIRSLTVSNFPERTLRFYGTFNHLEEIKVSSSNVKTLGSHAFKHVRALKRLDLSENSISHVEKEAFSEVNSLLHLSLASSFSPGFDRLPPEIFENLTSVETLDLSNNGLKILPQKLFHSMKRLKIILLKDNFIEFIPRRAFQGDVHSDLTTIQLSYNQLSFIESYTFSDLNNLQSLWLNDNRIRRIDKRAFTNLNRLRHLYIRGNEINYLNDETFQNLPELEKLDLAYNRLRVFNYDCLEQVGTLSSFVLNMSFNLLEQMSAKESGSDQQGILPQEINVKALDLSHNNISFLGPKVFEPIEPSLTHLYLSHNDLRNMTKNTFGGLVHLQLLDVSYNKLTSIEPGAFALTTNIQILLLGHNFLSEMPKNLFNGFHNLRIVDLANNEFRLLRESIFKDSTVERLDMSSNHLAKVPLFSFYGDTGRTLLELDLSGNMIGTLPTPDNLLHLNLSKNHLIRIDDGTFAYLNKLQTLDLSDNVDLVLDSKGQTFYGLDKTLENLMLKNLSISEMPHLHLPTLETLDLSSNDIVNVPLELSHNLTNLKKLELANNKLYMIPGTLNAFTKLEYLGISGNPLESLNFQQSFTLREVDLRNVSLDVLEKGTLGKIPCLESLKLTLNETSQDLNLPYLLKENFGLNHLQVEVLENGGFYLTDEMNGWFPVKLQNLTLVGRGLKTVSRNLLQGIRSPTLNLNIFNTSVEEITDEVFHNAKRIRNLTLNLKWNKIHTLYNPNTGRRPNLPKTLFVTNLEVTGNEWLCDCTIGGRGRKEIALPKMNKLIPPGNPLKQKMGGPRRQQT